MKTPYGILLILSVSYTVMINPVFNGEVKNGIFYSITVSPADLNSIDSLPNTTQFPTGDFKMLSTFPLSDSLRIKLEKP